MIQWFATRHVKYRVRKRGKFRKGIRLGAFLLEWRYIRYVAFESGRRIKGFTDN